MRRGAKSDEAAKPAPRDSERAASTTPETKATPTTTKAAPAAAKAVPAPAKAAPAPAPGKKRPRVARKRAVTATALEKTIVHRFKDRDLLDRSLTHISVSGGNRANSYQRLEFLGDHVLGLIIS